MQMTYGTNKKLKKMINVWVGKHARRNLGGWTEPSHTPVDPDVSTEGDRAYAVIWNWRSHEYEHVLTTFPWLWMQAHKMTILVSFNDTYNNHSLPRNAKTVRHSAFSIPRKTVNQTKVSEAASKRKAWDRGRSLTSENTVGIPELVTGAWTT
jgi:hypothetical protein